MLRLGILLEKSLLSNGIDVAVIRPEPFFGLFARRWFALNKWLRYLVRAPASKSVKTNDFKIGWWNGVV